MNQYMVLFFIDLDDFKNINDNYGHQEGDFALIKTTEALKSTFRQSDIIGRVGGDEFVALVIQDSPIDTNTVLKRLDASFNSVNEQMERKYKITASVGFASYQPDQKITIDNLISIADRMMYENKRKRKKLT